MNTPLIETLKHCPQTLEYLTLDKDGDCVLQWDIEGLQQLLPVLVTLSDGKDDIKKWNGFAIAVSWVLTHLIEIRDELKGGEA